jgi:hypothetical protein
MTHSLPKALPLIATLAATATLAACGNANSPTSSRAGNSNAASTAPATAATTETQPPAATKPAAPRQGSHPPGSTRDSEGPAASFRVAQGDNSIPEYGHEAPQNEKAHALTTLTAFLRARASHQWSRACSYLTTATRRSMTRLARAAGGSSSGDGCAVVLAALSKIRTTAASAQTLGPGAAAMRISASNAFLLYHGADGGQFVMPMANEHRAWKMTKPAPIPYPPTLSGAAAP